MQAAALKVSEGTRAREVAQKACGDQWRAQRQQLILSRQDTTICREFARFHNQQLNVCCGGYKHSLGTLSGKACGLAMSHITNLLMLSVSYAISSLKRQKFPEGSQSVGSQDSMGGIPSSSQILQLAALLRTNRLTVECRVLPLKYRYLRTTKFCVCTYTLSSSCHILPADSLLASRSFCRSVGVYSIFINI